MPDFTQQQKRRNAAITAKRYFVEAVRSIARDDPWLTCNQVGCGLVCADVHVLYLHKRGHSAAPEPEPYSLIPSTLTWV